MQCCIMMGRVVADPVRRLTASGVPVASWRLAVDRDRSGADGQRAADYIDCIAWRGLADVVSKWWRKGKPMLVSGRMQSRSYTDRDGVRRRAVELVADGVHFVPRDGSGGTMQPVDVSACETIADALPWVDTPQSIGLLRLCLARGMRLSSGWMICRSVEVAPVTGRGVKGRGRDTAARRKPGEDMLTRA